MTFHPDLFEHGPNVCSHIFSIEQQKLPPSNGLKYMFVIFSDMPNMLKLNFSDGMMAWRIFPHHFGWVAKAMEAARAGQLFEPGKPSENKR